MWSCALTLYSLCGDSFSAISNLHNTELLLCGDRNPLQLSEARLFHPLASASAHIVPPSGITVFHSVASASGHIVPPSSISPVASQCSTQWHRHQNQLTFPFGWHSFLILPLLYLRPKEDTKQKSDKMLRSCWHFQIKNKDAQKVLRSLELFSLLDILSLLNLDCPLELLSFMDIGPPESSAWRNLTSLGLSQPVGLHAYLCFHFIEPSFVW